MGQNQIFIETSQRAAEAGRFRTANAQAHFVVDEGNMEILYEYLRSILYDVNIKAPDLSFLEEPYRKFGESLKVLHGYVENMQACMGEPPNALDAMVSQMKEREAALKEEKNQIKRDEELLDSYKELFVGLSKKRKEWILVVDSETKQVVYCNKNEFDSGKAVGFGNCEACGSRLPFYDRILVKEADGQNSVWEIKDGSHGYYRVTTFSLDWKNRKANAHILKDITDEKLQTNSLKDKAYHDALTGIHNRIFFEEYMENILRKRETFNLGYLDLDCLKIVNDQYGHGEGDQYIRRFVSVIQENFRTTDVFCRVGGDEFCLILEETSKDVVTEKLQKIMEEFRRYDDKEYIHGFSFGVVEVDGSGASRTLAEIIQEADSAMYECKRQNKEFYRQRQEEDRR